MLFLLAPSPLGFRLSQTGKHRQVDFADILRSLRRSTCAVAIDTTAPPDAAPFLVCRALVDTQIRSRCIGLNIHFHQDRQERAWTPLGDTVYLPIPLRVPIAHRERRARRGVERRSAVLEVVELLRA